MYKSKGKYVIELNKNKKVGWRFFRNINETCKEKCVRKSVNRRKKQWIYIAFFSDFGPLSRMVVVVLDECHKTFVSCFHAFYPTGQLKWSCLCDLLLSRDMITKVSWPVLPCMLPPYRVVVFCINLFIPIPLIFFYICFLYALWWGLQEYWHCIPCSF